MVTRNERGALLIPLLLLTAIVAVTGFGIWGMMRSWKKQAELQLKLDKCVGLKAKELQSMLGKLESSNKRMVWARRAAAAALALSPVTPVAPVALEAIQAELMIELALQEGLRLKWGGEGLAAVIGKTCDGLRVFPIRYPLLEWNRAPPDEIGPQAFEWDKPDPEFSLLFKSSNHLSGAKVKEEKNGKDHWVARWAGIR